MKRGIEKRRKKRTKRREDDLREGVSQDAILPDEEKMKEINKKLEKLRIGSCTKPLRNDLKKKKVM